MPDAEKDALLGALRCDHFALSNDEIAALHAALIEADAHVLPPGEWDDCGHHPEWSSKNGCRHPNCVTSPGEWDDCGHHPEWSSKNGCRHPNCVTSPGEGREQVTPDA